MQIKHLTLLSIISLGLAWIFDQLFWQKPPGISFLIFVFLCLAAGWLLTYGEQLHPVKTSLVLIVPILSFAGVVFLRLEPFTLFISCLLTFVSMVMLSLTWLGGRWWAYSFGDYTVNLIRWFGLVLYLPLKIFQTKMENKNHTQAGNPGSSIPLTEQVNRSTKANPALSVAFGLLLALPVVGFFGTLLVSADPIFSKQIANLLSIFNLESLTEYIIRTTYILLGAYLLGGVFLYSLLYSQAEKAHTKSKALISPFLGWIVATTVLVSVNLLFASFVAVQFRYFFGGHTNIALDGFTYAEYARRGFGELVVVAFFSLLLVLGLNTVTRRNPGWSHRAYSILSIILVGFVCIMLFSAFQRLLLYEAAYGFTRSRTYSHIFMLWLGVLLLCVVALEAAHKFRYMSLALFIVAIGFGISLFIINIDSFVVRQNISRAAHGKPLDTGYLVTLSDDAVPELIRQFEMSTNSQNLHDQIGGVLACRIAISTVNQEPRAWYSLNLSHEKAKHLYQVYQEELAVYTISRPQSNWQVTVNGNEIGCLTAGNYQD